MDSIVYNTIGTIGVAFILITYLLLQTGHLESKQLRYSLLNLSGSSMILFSLIYEFNLPSFIVEIFWVLISLFGIGRTLYKRYYVASDSSGVPVPKAPIMALRFPAIRQRKKLNLRRRH